MNPLAGFPKGDWALSDMGSVVIEWDTIKAKILALPVQQRAAFILDLVEGATGGTLRPALMCSFFGDPPMPASECSHCEKEGVSLHQHYVGHPGMKAVFERAHTPDIVAGAKEAMKFLKMPPIHGDGEIE